MQNTQQQISAEILVATIWHSMVRLSGSIAFQDMPLHILSILYAYHKGYPIHIKNGHIDHTVSSDPLYLELINAAPINDAAHSVLCNLQKELEQIDRDHFNKIYAEVLKGLFDRINTSSGLSNGDFYTPQEITQLMAFILNRENCSSFYDPFCGTASIAHELSRNTSSIKFDGQELNHRIALYAKVNLEATCGSNGEIRVCDSTMQWNCQKYDAVVTCPPFNLRLANEQLSAIYNLVPHIQCRSVEGMALIAPFSANYSKLSVVLAPTGFCFRGANGSRDYELRRYLIEENLLDTVIALPSKILYGTSIPSVILICKKYRTPNTPVTFIHAEEYFLGENRKRTLDVKRLITMMETSREDCVEVQNSEIRNFDYNLNPALYYKKDYVLNEGQQVIRLGDLITPIDGEYAHNVIDRISHSNMSSDFIQILLNNSKTTDKSESQREISFRRIEASDKKYLLSHTTGSDSEYGLFCDKQSFTYPVDIKVYVVNENLVTPEYLAYALVNNPAISKSRMALTNYMSFPIVLDSLDTQKEIVNKIIQEYTAKVHAEQEADAKRLGIKQNISDLEHMLGTTQHRINMIIERLESITPEMANYQHVVKQLKDNIEYMNRIIQYSNATIDSDSINRKDADFIEYITSYIDGWRNYGNNCFELSVVNELGENPSISFDRNMLTVMLDSILNNAARHGFDKRKRMGNSVQLKLSTVKYESKPYVLISIANNGESMSSSFTIEDYISRGRYTASTGRSGLGGYHTFQIAKGHGGFLCLDSNKQWSVIIEVLLPIDSTNINNIQDYDHECL